MAMSASTTTRHPVRDYRRGAVLAVPFSIALLATIVSLLPGRGVDEGSPQANVMALPTMAPHPPTGFRDDQPQEKAMANPATLRVDPAYDRAGHVSEVRQVTLDALKQLAREFIADNQPDQAAEVLLKATHLVPDDPEPFQLMGDVMMQRMRFAEAREYYESAIDRAPYRAEPYFGHATASEALGDLESALGGMRSFLHVVEDKDPYRLKVAQARSAIWEWESQLGRGPWGPTRGVPPGFTAEELRRDGQGVAIKMPVPGTEDQNGVSAYEIKHAEKNRIFKKE